MILENSFKIFQLLKKATKKSNQKPHRNTEKDMSFQKCKFKGYIQKQQAER